ncbi:MAG TPA: 16S rRNA (cytosine(1402)-N(4))-methyltransferase RsmH [Anaerolineae bacterium]|nr:16S rRNA (cytosine(1402)-N(4))-methyltransferase RsmH [Anaerolineae bacterium]
MSRRRRPGPEHDTSRDSAVHLSHEPVLYAEVLAELAPRSGGRYVDGTVGAGGHAKGILERSAPDGRLLGIDRDDQALALAQATLAGFGDRLTLVQGDAANIAVIARQAGFAPADGILLDVGVSSMQLEAAERGFSFLHDGPLDMRMDRRSAVTAASLVNELEEEELANLLFGLGEERQSRRIARAIVAARPLHTTSELANVVAQAVPRRGRLHPATRTFQALRIATNDELGQLSRGLEGALEVLGEGGRLAVICFHSLEDRLVKRLFQRESTMARDSSRGPSVSLVTRHPIQPSREEQLRNPRSRSAKLRVVEKVRRQPQPGGDTCV